MRLLLVGALALNLSGCGWLGLDGREVPTLTASPVARERSVDPREAARLINAHRAANGLAALAVDPVLSSIAADTADRLAGRDRLKTAMHTSGGLSRRLRAARYDADRAAENLGAGYPTLLMAVDGWKGSKGHNANLLNPDLTRMGIGLALTDEGRFHSYWVLLLARPSEAA